jgi:hypothetical protein
MFAEEFSQRVPQGAWPDGVAEKGTWHGGRKADDTRTASLSCPDCGKIGSLSDHKIDDQGRVSPSVVCPTKGCDFHEWLILDGWEA